MSDTLHYTSIQDAKAHGAVCGCCHITGAERKLSTCAGCKIVQYDSISSMVHRHILTFAQILCEANLVSCDLSLPDNITKQSHECQKKAWTSHKVGVIKVVIAL